LLPQKTTAVCTLHQDWPGGTAFPGGFSITTESLAPMHELTSLKISIVRHLQQMLEEALLETKQALAAMQESLTSETKSTAGDKYETGRAMVQIELQKLSAQHDKLSAQLQTLAKVDPQRACASVEFGSLVQTAQESYFFAIPAGKITVDGQVHYAISMASPIGSLLQGKTVGQSAAFQGRELRITGVA
jgi:transcription elongation GreA/GreB family factor